MGQRAGVGDDDVAEQSNYLSCNPRVRSEIVIPIIKDDEVVAELDIDSHSPAPFTEHDRSFLEKTARRLVTIF